MPFAKRVVEPQSLCRQTGGGLDDLCSISNVCVSRAVRQLSDLAKHACSLFQDLEDELVSTNQRLRALRARIGGLQQSASELDPKRESVPVSNLDVESKLDTHYRSVCHVQRNIFLPGSRPPCVEELHQRARQSLRALYRDQQQRQEVSERERKVTASISMAPPIPVYPSPHPSRNRKRLQTFKSAQSSSATECCHFSPWSRKAVADPDQDDTLLGQRPKCPVPNVPSTLDKQTNWTGVLPLPTPEDRMRSQSQCVASCTVPIDVTEEVPIDAPPSEMAAFLRAGFDREASVRYSLVHSQSVLQRRRKPRRRRTGVAVPRRGQHEADSDESPVAGERTVIIHASPGACEVGLTLSRLRTRDSGCQTDELLASVGAPSRRRIRAQRGPAGAVPLSHSTGNISTLPDNSDGTYSVSSVNRLRSRSLPREGGRLADEGHDDSNDDDEEEEEELSPSETEDFLPVPGEHMLKDDIESPDDQVASARQLGGSERQLEALKFKQSSESLEHVWMERGRPRLTRKADVESCEISSSSDTFSSPIHSNAGVLASQMDHKDDHQSSSGNWSGSSSTCPSQTSETMPPAASPPLTGSSHCDSELSLNAAPHASEDSTSFMHDPYSGDRLRGEQMGSCPSTATDTLDDAGLGTASEGEWGYPQYRHHVSCHSDFSPEPSRAEEGSLECPSFTSIATLESLDRPPSEQADTVSHFSVDAEGYYTSMHFDCGLKGGLKNYALADQRKAEHSGPATLGRRSLSLRKPKVKPSPPKRSTSLKKISGHAAEASEPKITGEQLLPMSSRERRVQSGLSEGAEPVEPWAVQISNATQDDTSIGSHEAHSFKDEGAVQADYADLWLLKDLRSNDPYRSLSNSSTATGTTVVECVKSQESSESQASQCGSRATTPSLPPVETELKLPSPEKLAGLASPSSGYSSQSETPTSSVPLAFFPNLSPLSPPHGKRKPKVPERKSSLASLQQYISKGDLELPIIPPTHLNLSALQNVSKPLTFRNHTPVLHQKVAAAETETGSPSSANAQPDGCSVLVITPTALRSVRLRSVGKPVEGKHDRSGTDPTTRPKCPSFTAVSANTRIKSKESTPHGTLAAEAISQENCEPLPTPADPSASASATTNRYDRLAPALLKMAAVSTTSEQAIRDDIVTDVSQYSVDQNFPAKQQTSTPKGPFPQRSMETDEDQPVMSEPPEAGTKTGFPLGHHGVGETSDPSFDQVPDFFHQSSLESSKNNQISDASSQEEESMTSGVPTRSASEESVEEVSTPDTEGYFSKESTPSDSAVSPLTDDVRAEDDGVFLSPSKSRTTEDLFAMIHRSKRKVFGRKDSGEKPSRSRPSASSVSASPPTSSPSTPVSPTTPTNSQKASGPIYRSIKKSSTSNEEFKLLLLKKGSRSDSSYRMSATEILKSPIAPKSFGESLLEGGRQPEEFSSPSPLLSPERTPEHLSSPYPKAVVEGFSTKPFPTTASSRQGRSRIPPAASSSRYSTRSRLYTAPMQAISEGETENSDGSPHDDRSS